MSFLIALLGLGFLIFFHELGHFIAAKLCGVAVLEFSIGMGPRLFSFVWRNTRYSIKLLPLGGSCAMLGEDAAGSGDFLTATGKECLKDEFDPTAAQTVIDYDGVQFSKEDLPKYTFQGKSAGKRFFICIAGVLNNFIIAFIMAAVLIHFAGFDPLYVVGTESNAPASSIGLAPGDRVTGINYQGKRIKSMPSYRSLYIWKYLNTPDFNENTVLTIRYQHNGHTMLSDFKPYYSEDQKTYNLG
ncbi:MAG TPA: peptidase M50, partial [Oribacterium sp.]|nr:peptidase M50 [Oribacterium sp.]